MNPSSRYHQKASTSIQLKLILIMILLLQILCTDNNSLKSNNLDHLDINKNKLEIPKISEDLVINHHGYSLQYSERHEQPIWVAYLLTREEVYCTTSRTEDFRTDSLILSNSATNDDYKNSGYVRGHIKPAADSKYSKEEMSASFLLSNISPMTWSFNEGIWLNLERRVRDWAILYDSLFIVSGPILSDSLKTIGENRVSIPQYFYKAIIEVTDKELRGIGFIIPHETSSLDFMQYAIPIDSIENVLNIDLFPNLPDSIESFLEGHINF